WIADTAGWPDTPMPAPESCRPAHPRPPRRLAVAGTARPATPGRATRKSTPAAPDSGRYAATTHATGGRIAGLNSGVRRANSADPVAQPSTGGHPAAYPRPLAAAPRPRAVPAEFGAR